MSPIIPDREPTQFVSGDTLIWNRSVPDYPATDGWTLKYAFRGVGKFDAEAVALGSGYAITVASTDTAVAPGLYEWIAWVENTATPVEKHTVGSGRVIVQPQLSTITDASRQQHAERMLPLIEAQLEQLAASPIETYTIEQQTTVRRKITELHGLRAQYLGELRRLRGRGRPRHYKAHFGRA